MLHTLHSGQEKVLTLKIYKKDSLLVEECKYTPVQWRAESTKEPNTLARNDSVRFMRCRKQSGQIKKLGGIPTFSVSRLAHSVPLAGLVCTLLRNCLTSVDLKDIKSEIKEFGQDCKIAINQQKLNIKE